MRRNMKLKIGGAIGAIALVVAAPVALAQTDGAEESEASTYAGDLICFEVDNPFFNGVGLGGAWAFDEEWPVDVEWLEDVDELPALPDEVLEALNQEAVKLAAHLVAAGVAHEMVEGPMGESWVEWDFADEAANAAVDEFYEGRDDIFEVFVDDFPFEDDETLFDDGFGFIDPGGFPFEGEICVEVPAAQAEVLSTEMEGLAGALAKAGVTFATETVQVQVPVWDYEDEAARDVVEQYYSGLHDAEFEDWHETVEVVGAES